MTINNCFKGVFISLNILMGVAGSLLLGFGMLGHAHCRPPGEFEQMSAISFLYVTGGATLALSICGVYGAHNEKKWALIVFFTGMGALAFLVIVILTLVGGIMTIESANRLFRESVPLDKARPDVQKAINVLQPELKCCGAFDGYQDWGNHVPDSCLCPSITDKCEKMNGVELALDIGNATDVLSDGSEKLVYKEPCAPYVINYMEKAINTIFVLWICGTNMAFIGMVMSMTMILKIRRESSPVTFSIKPSPPRYTELHNTMQA
ncbi:hypothetical protein SKAU_G00105200 [Synaphobranchus kaupii]|uniref:Tetraspanin n=1 Tax=Synaphobranchus kaupii TaxID=118154 RepID=A0A9Q1G007_SYNKA|nr:hypothetical protein SKAU_G00105200 [Synaphobranchus kaupii]